MQKMNLIECILFVLCFGFGFGSTGCTAVLLWDKKRRFNPDYNYKVFFLTQAGFLFFGFFAGMAWNISRKIYNQSTPPDFYLIPMIAGVLLAWVIGWWILFRKK